MLEGVRVQVRPEGEAEYVRVTVPVKLLTGAIVNVELPDAPARTETLVGLAARVKSVTWTVTVAVCVRSPLDPMTET